MNRKKREMIKMVNRTYDDDNKIDDITDFKLAHRESGEWVSLSKNADVSEGTKADALESLAEELRQKQE